MEHARPHSPRQRSRSENGKVDWSAHSRGVRQDVKGAPPKEEKAKEPESTPTGKAKSVEVPDSSRTSLMTPTSSTRGAKRPPSPRAKFSPGNVQALSIDLIQSSISKTTNLQQQLETMESALKQKTKEHSEVLIEVATLKKLLRDKEKGLAQTTSELEKQKEKSLQLEVQIAHRTSALRDAEVTIRSKNEETRRLNTTSTMSERNQEALLETLQNRRNMDNLEQDLYTARQDVERLMEELRAKDKELKYRAENLKNLESQLSQERLRGIEAARKEGATELSAALRQLSGMHDENRSLARELKDLTQQMERERDKASSSAPSTSTEDVSEDIGRLQNENRKLKEKLEEMERSGRAQQMLRERLSKRLSVIDQTMRASGQRPSRSSVFSCSASEVSFTDRGESTAGSVVSPTASEVAEEHWDMVPGAIHDILQKELVISTKSLSERDRLLQEKDLALELCLRKCDTLDHARESAERKLRREISTLQKEASMLRTNLHDREEAIKEEKKELKRDIFTLKNQLVQAANRSS